MGGDIRNFSTVPLTNLATASCTNAAQQMMAKCQRFSATDGN